MKFIPKKIRNYVIVGALTLSAGTSTTVSSLSYQNQIQQISDAVARNDESTALQKIAEMRNYFENTTITNIGSYTFDQAADCYYYHKQSADTSINNVKSEITNTVINQIIKPLSSLVSKIKKNSQVMINLRKFCCERVEGAITSRINYMKKHVHEEKAHQAFTPIYKAFNDIKVKLGANVTANKKDDTQMGSPNAGFFGASNNSAEIKKLEKEIQTLTTNVNNLTQDKKNLEEKYETLETEKTELEEENNQLKEDKENAETTLTEKDSIITDLNKEIDSLKAIVEKEEQTKDLFDSCNDGKFETFDAAFNKADQASRLDLNTITKDGKTMLHVNAENGNLEIVKALTEDAKYYSGGTGSAKINNQDNDGNTILHLAVKNGQAEVVEYLLSKENIDLTKTNKAGNMPLDMLDANAEQKETIEKMMHDKGAQYSDQADKFKQALLEIIEKENDDADALIKTIEFAQNLTGETFDVSTITYDNGKTLLHKACEHEKVDIAKALTPDVSSSLNPFPNYKPLVKVAQKDEQGNTALHSACNTMNYKLIEQLVKCFYYVNATDINEKNDTEKTALDIVCEKPVTQDQEQTQENIKKLLKKYRAIRSEKSILEEAAELKEAFVNEGHNEFNITKLLLLLAQDVDAFKEEINKKENEAFRKELLGATASLDGNNELKLQEALTHENMRKELKENKEAIAFVNPVNLLKAISEDLCDGGTIEVRRQAGEKYQITSVVGNVNKKEIEIMLK